MSRIPILRYLLRGAPVRRGRSGGISFPLLLIFAPVVVAWGGSVFSSSPEPRRVVATPTFTGEAVVGDAVPEAIAPPEVAVLRQGEALEGLLARIGIGPRETLEIAEALEDHVAVRRIRPGLKVVGTADGDVGARHLEMRLRHRGRLHLRSGPGEGWTSRFEPFSREVRVRSARGTIESSLVGALESAGAPVQVAYEMAEVLQWDVDFYRDLRAGDRFEVLYEVVFLDGDFDGVGEILALRLINRGREIQGYRFEDGYYDAEGRPLEKMFLRSPLPFTRVTSHFSRSRFHPVLKRYRPHYGVDYGAPTGTPVRVTASGVVTFAGRNGGAGRMVKVRHPNRYLSAYLHLSRISPGIRPGARVRQGEIVGRVGSSGLATGPHLDYRVQHRGRWIDPLSLEAVPAEPIADERRAEFRAERDRFRELLTGVPDPAPSSDRAVPVVAAAPDRSGGRAGR